MTTPRGSGWQEAILAVLNDAEEPLDYNEITRLIGERGLRTLTGATPANTVNRTLASMVNDQRIAKTGRGLYALPEAAQRAEKEAVAEEAEAEAAAGILYINCQSVYSGVIPRRRCHHGPPPRL